MLVARKEHIFLILTFTYNCILLALFSQVFTLLIWVEVVGGLVLMLKLNDGKKTVRNHGKITIITFVRLYILQILFGQGRGPGRADMTNKNIKL